MKKITVALAGNPNSGKTTIFNMLTGARQHVGNYPGVTVEKVEGLCHYKGYDIKFIDLPGTYSLSAYSIEEIVARNYLIDRKPDVVVDVVDASNIERNLYLATQLIEMDMPLVLALNGSLGHWLLMALLIPSHGHGKRRELLHRLRSWSTHQPWLNCLPFRLNVT